MGLKSQVEVQKETHPHPRKELTQEQKCFLWRDHPQLRGLWAMLTLTPTDTAAVLQTHLCHIVLQISECSIHATGRTEMAGRTECSSCDQTSYDKLARSRRWR